jgi:hypothetical protein
VLVSQYVRTLRAASGARSPLFLTPRIIVALAEQLS